MVSQGHVQAGFEYLHGWRLHSLSEQPAPVSGHPLCSSQVTCPYLYLLYASFLCLSFGRSSLFIHVDSCCFWLLFCLVAWAILECGEGCPWKSTSFPGLLFIPGPDLLFCSSHSQQQPLVCPSAADLALPSRVTMKPSLMKEQGNYHFWLTSIQKKIRVDVLFFNLRKGLLLKYRKIRNLSIFGPSSLELASLGWCLCASVQLSVIQTNLVFSCLAFAGKDQWLRSRSRSFPAPISLQGRSCLLRCFDCQQSPSSWRAIFC